MNAQDLARRAMELQAAIEVCNEPDMAEDPRMFEAYRLIGEAARRLWQVSQEVKN